MDVQDSSRVAPHSGDFWQVMVNALLPVRGKWLAGLEVMCALDEGSLLISALKDLSTRAKRSLLKNLKSEEKMFNYLMSSLQNKR